MSNQGVLLPCSSPYYSCVAASPAGLVCQITGNHFTARTFSSHLKKDHKDWSLPLRLPHNLPVQFQGLIESARNDPNRSRFAKDGSNTANRYFCNNCKSCFKDKDKMNRHLSQQKRKSIKCTLSDCNRQQCMQLFCRRYYPVTDSNAAESTATSIQHPASSHSPNSDLAGADVLSQLANPNLAQFDFSSIGAELGTLCTQGRTLTETTIRNLLSPQSSTEHLVELFHQLVSQHGAEDAFLDGMLKNVESMDKHKICILSDERMSRLVEAFILMLQNYIGPNKMVTRNLSSLMVRFNTDDEHGNVHNTERHSFRERKTQHDVLNAFKELLAFLQHKQPPCFQEVMEKLADTSIDPEIIHKQCIIPNLLYHLAAEEPSNREHDTLYIEYALSGMFTASGASLRFKSTGGCSSCLATALYLIRFCMMYKAASILKMNNQTDRNGLVKRLFAQVQGRPSTQNLSKGISVLRIRLKSEAKPEKVRVDQEGNFSLKGLVFRQVFYRGLMKVVATNLHHLFCRIFEGEDWKCCLSENARFTFGDDSFYGDIVCEATTSESEAPVTVVLNELSLKSNISGTEDELIQKLNSLFELVFLGLGGGAERKASITSMTSNQVCIIPDSSSVYYTLVHQKQYRVETMDRTPSNHKMASIFFPYYLLFRRVVSLLNTAQEEKCLVFIKIDKPSWTVSNWMGKFFHLNHAELSFRIIRQFFTSITTKIATFLRSSKSKLSSLLVALLPSLAIILSLLTLQAMQHFWQTTTSCSTISFTWSWALPLLPVQACESFHLLLQAKTESLKLCAAFTAQKLATSVTVKGKWFLLLAATARSTSFLVLTVEVAKALQLPFHLLSTFCPIAIQA